MPSPIQLSFIILAWNSDRYLPACFDSIVDRCADAEISFEVIVIDNGSQDYSLDLIRQYREKHPQAFHLIALNSNRGTTYSRNLGINLSRGECICILDSDAQLTDGSLLELMNRLHSQTDIGIIAPRLLLPDGSVQNSVKRFPTMVNKLVKIPAITLGIKTKNADFYNNFPFKEETYADSAISACWFFRRDILQQVGYFDERIFAAPEDLDYSLRVRRTGLRILYYPSFTVFHHTQQISHKQPFSKYSLSHFFGLVYYFRKHGGWLIRPRHGV